MDHDANPLVVYSAAGKACCVVCEARARSESADNDARALRAAASAAIGRITTEWCAAMNQSRLRSLRSRSAHCAHWLLRFHRVALGLLARASDLGRGSGLGSHPGLESSKTRSDRRVETSGFHLWLGVFERAHGWRRGGRLHER